MTSPGSSGSLSCYHPKICYIKISQELFVCDHNKNTTATPGFRGTAKAGACFHLICHIPFMIVLFDPRQNNTV